VGVALENVAVDLQGGALLEEVARGLLQELLIVREVEIHPGLLCEGGAIITMYGSAAARGRSLREHQACRLPGVGCPGGPERWSVLALSRVVTPQ
jgi:hypothetical protein